MQDPKTRQVQLSVREALQSKKEDPSKNSESKFYNSLNYSDNDDDDNEVNFDARMRNQILRKRKELGDHPLKPKLPNGTHFSSPNVYQCVKFCPSHPYIEFVLHFLPLLQLMPVLYCLYNLCRFS